MAQIKKILFIGGNRFSENGPLLSFFEVCKKKNLDCTLITDNEHLKYPCANGNLFEKELDKKKLKFICVQSLNDINCHDLIKRADLIFSVNCRWILNKNLIQLAKGKIFNYHNSSLPEQQGAGCHSWRIMQGIKKFHLTVHHLTEQIDEGDTIYEQEINVPAHCKNLIETYSFISEYEIEAFKSCLDGIIKTFPDIDIIHKKFRKSYYWPRLSTETNAFIDWEWNVQEIKNFCHAFDEPFQGASTFLDGERVWFKNVEVDEENIQFHPFQYGIIYRIEKTKTWIAAKNGGLLVNHIIIPNKLKLKKGKRFITDYETLLKAKKNFNLP